MTEVLLHLNGTLTPLVTDLEGRRIMLEVA